jgi:general secretion pathway protein A
MYREFYGFSEYPFSLNPDPRFLFLAISHFEALASMLAGVKERKGITVITGEPGTGKTTLVHALLKDLSEKIKPAFAFHTTIQFPDLLQEILTELGVPVSDPHLPNLLVLFGQYLKERMARDETVAIIVDEAQNLEVGAIASLFGLHHRESPAGKLVQIILVGQTELEAKLDSPELQSFKEIIAIRRRVRPLNSKECEEYIDHRLRVVGSSSSKIFTPEAVSRIGQSSGGIPRIINVLCDNALIAGSAVRPKIDEKIAAKAIQEMGYLQPHAPLNPPEYLQPDFFPHIEKSPQDVSRPSIFRPFNWRPKKHPILILGILMVIFVGWGVLYFWDWGQKVQFLAERKETPSGKSGSRTVSIKGGMKISSLAKQYYLAANPTLVDFILEFNPQIVDLNRISIDQQIQIPAITPHLLLSKTSDQSYQIHLGTFEDRRKVEVYKNIPFLKDKKFEVVPRKVSPKMTWFRIMVGDFKTAEEGLGIIDTLRKQGQLPAFAGSSQ